MHVKRRRRITFTKTMIQAMLFSGDKAEIDSLKAAHKNYLNAELLLSDINENTDKALYEQYERIRHLRPVASLRQDGVVAVEGILSELEALL